VSSSKTRRRWTLWASILGALAGCPATPPEFPQGGTGDTSSEGSTAAATSTSTAAATTEAEADTNPGTRGSDAGAELESTAGTDDPSADTTTAADVPADRAFRINSLELRDPHIFYGFGGDVTAAFNDQLAAWLEPAPDGGTIDLGLVLSFAPLDQTDGAQGELTFANASCSGRDANTCVPRKGTDLHVTTYTSRPSGPCLSPDPDHLNPEYEPPQAPASSCFTLEPFDVRVVAQSVELPLQMAEVSAQHVGDPSSNLVVGLLRGYIPVDVAQDTPVQIEGLGQASLASLLQAADRDETADDNGWWFYFQFTALMANWAPD
jgi:hypothetical protein